MTSKDAFSIDSITRITDKDKRRCINAEIYSAKDQVVRGAMNVSEATGIPLNTCKRICSLARTRLEELGVVDRPFISPVHNQSSNLDNLLGGRELHIGAITEVFGGSNSGKTQLCHTISVMVQLAKNQGGLAGKALYIDTESTFIQERIGQIAEARGLDRTQAISNILLAKAMRHMLMLRRFSEIYRVVVSNQVNQSPEEFRGAFPGPVGGNIMAHASTFRIRLGQFGYLRRADLIHSPFLPEGQAHFGLSKQGVNDGPEPEPLR